MIMHSVFYIALALCQLAAAAESLNATLAAHVDASRAEIASAAAAAADAATTAQQARIDTAIAEARAATEAQAKSAQLAVQVPSDICGS